MRLKGKHILVGITGSIAAYKTASLVRLLVTEGAEVRVVMTKLAKEFITPLTMATLSRHPILVDFFNPENGEWNSHVSLGEWADAYVIAPATANTIGKMVSGTADNLLTTAYLSARCPVFVAPAMDLDMYAHVSTRRNLKQLREDGVHLIEPGSGFLASGLNGKGRMAEPETICGCLCDFLQGDQPLTGRKALVTVGGTIEKIDAVRYISNYSTGKMGYALAAALAEKGAEVTVVRANVQNGLAGSVPGVREIEALSADAMYRAVEKEKETQDILVMAAAVADFTPKNPAGHKIKKQEGEAADRLLLLTETKDIAAAVGKGKRANQTLVGFALETNDEKANAQHKMQKKNLDYVVLNSLNDKGAGFGHDTNRVTVYARDGREFSFPLDSKREIARRIVGLLIAEGK